MMSYISWFRDYCSSYCFTSSSDRN